MLQLNRLYFVFRELPQTLQNGFWVDLRALGNDTVHVVYADLDLVSTPQGDAWQLPAVFLPYAGRHAPLEAIRYWHDGDIHPGTDEPFPQNLKISKFVI